MAAIPVNQDVVIYPKGRAGGDQPYAAFITGVVWRSDVGVGGGPVFPPGGGGGGGDPPHPDHTLPGDLPHPEHPIVIPPEPPIPPVDTLPQPVPPNSVLKPAPEGGGWMLVSNPDSSLNWVYDPPAGGVGGPKR